MFQRMPAARHKKLCFVHELYYNFLDYKKRGCPVSSGQYTFDLLMLGCCMAVNYIPFEVLWFSLGTEGSYELVLCLLWCVISP